MSKEAMKLALEALEGWGKGFPDNWGDLDTEAVSALKEALAQQALDKKAENARELGLDYEPAQDSGVVTAGGFDPRTQRPWVGLTDEEIWETVSRIGTSDSNVNPYAKLADARAIEAKLKEKNT